MANGIQILPTLDRFAGLRQGAQNFVGGLINQQQQRGQLADQQAILQFIQARNSGQSPGLPQLKTPQGNAALSGLLSQQPSLAQQRNIAAETELTQARTEAIRRPAQQPGFTLGQGQRRFGPGGELIAEGVPGATPGFTLGQGQQRFDASGRPIAAVSPEAVATRPGFTLSEGQQRFDESGRRIASVAAAPLPEKPKAGSLQVSKINDPSGLPEGTVFQADPQGNIKIISEAGGEELSKTDRLKLAVMQAKEFRADKRIENLNIIERSERGMQAALRQARTGKSRIASDQALGVLFQKMLDPTSVVRESEFARTPQGAALINRIEGGVQQIVKGGLKITDEDRQALVDMAQKMLDEAKITANKAFSEFETRADELGLNKKIIFGNRKPFDIQTTEQIPQVRTPEQEARMQELIRKAGQ